MHVSRGGEVVIDRVTVKYGDAVAVNDLSLTIEAGTLVSLLGPSGSGKTTLLKTVAGFEEASSGSISVDGQVIDTLPVRFRNIGMVFQSYALFPHMTVRRNVAFGLKARRVDRATAKRAVDEALELVGLQKYGEQHPDQLSGGQRQRVALARAIVIRPRLLLMDEPLAALDLKLRQQLQSEIKQVQQHVGITTIYVTHDQEEALTLSDKIAVMDIGRISAIGSPKEIYHRPTTRFVASFVGNRTIIDVLSGESEISGLPGQHGVIAVDPDDRNRSLSIVLQPEDVQCHRDPVPGSAEGVVTARRFVGQSGLLTISVGDQVFQAMDAHLDLQVGDPVHVTWQAERAHVVHK